MLDWLRDLVPTRIRRSYAAKFGIVLLLIGLSVGGIGSAATVQITDEVQSGVNDDLATFAQQEATTVEGWTERNQEVTRIAAGSEVLRGSDTNAIGRYLTNQREQLPGAYDVHVVNFDGTVVASTTAEPGESLNDRPWTAQLEEVRTRDETQVAYSEPFEQDGVQLSAFFTRVGSNSDRVFVVTYETSTATADLQGTNRTEGGFTQIVHAPDGNVLFGQGNTTSGDYPDEDVLMAAREVSQTENATVVTSGPNEVLGEDHLVAIAAVPGTDWVAMVHAPQAAAYGFVTTVSQFGLLATVAGVLLITIFGAVLGRNTAAAIDRLTAKTQRMEEGDLSVDFSTDRIDNIGRLYGAFDSMRDALQEQIDEAQRARREAEEAREEAEMVNTHLVEKADEYSDVMRAVGEGDLTRRMDEESRNEAMSDIAVEFNEMIAEIEATTQNVKSFASEVATSSEEVTASSEEVKSASEQVTDSIQEISDGAERQNDQLQEVSSEMEGLSTTIEEIAASADQVADLSEETAQTGEAAREDAEVAIDEMETVQSEAEATVDAMEQLRDRMGEVEEITEFITDVAEQTNILALNANIEAARAGEAGEGFAVVAEEVKGLAEETREAAEEIDQLITDIQGQTERTAEEVERTAEEVSESVDIVRSTVESLEEIAGYAEETNTGIQEINDATSEQAASTNQVVGMVDEAASISEQTSRESENVAAAAEEQTTALTQVTNSASELAEQASRLSETLERFDTESEGVDYGDDDDPGAGDAPADEERRLPDDDGQFRPADEGPGAPGDDGSTPVDEVVTQGADDGPAAGAGDGRSATDDGLSPVDDLAPPADDDAGTGDEGGALADVLDGATTGSESEDGTGSSGADPGATADDGTGALSAADPGADTGLLDDEVLEEGDDAGDGPTQDDDAEDGRPLDDITEEVDELGSDIVADVLEGEADGELTQAFEEGETPTAEDGDTGAAAMADWNRAHDAVSGDLEDVAFDAENEADG
jgi:methyl-accepting chemotaxis protein